MTAPPRAGGRRIRPVAVGLVLALLGAAGGPAASLAAVQVQTPDTLQAVPSDTLELAEDTLGISPDTLEVPGDTVPDEPRFRVRNLPSFASGPPAGWAAGIWQWDQEDLRATRALTLLELLEEVPGVVPLRGGDIGQPATATAFGVAAGRVRVFWDGVELPPLDGGVVDLSRVGIAGLERVRVERGPAGLRIDLRPLEFADPRPYSFLEVGTGDLDTNLFRGVFAHPDALGGSIVLALDRLDTRGPQRQEPGVTLGGQIRHSLFFGERLGVAWEYRSITAQRPTELWEASDVQRTDFALRTRYQVAPELVAGVFFQRSSLSQASGGDAGGEPEELFVSEDPRTLIGARVSLERERWWAEADYRHHWGDGWPEAVQAIRAGGDVPAVGGGSLSVERQSWDEESPLSIHARIWSRPLWGVSAFAEFDDGRLGVPVRVPLDPLPDDEPGEPSPDPVELDPASVAERTGIRAGLEYRRGDFFLAGAVLTMEADSLHPTGLPPDREGFVVPGGDRMGVEGSVSLPLDRVLDGLSLQGSAQAWDGDESWRYLPSTTYEGRLSFHDVFLESGNLEVWADAGVWGRDAMSVPLGSPTDLQTVPFYQSWFGRLQIRVVSVRAFVRWDNFTLRPENQDYPGRILPQTRAMYGIRWTMWN